MAQQQQNIEKLNYSRKVRDFMRWSDVEFILSSIFLIVSIGIIAIKGFNWGLDFTGGIMIELSFENPADLDKIRKALEVEGIIAPILQNFGSSRDILVRMPSVKNNLEQEIGDKVLNLISHTIKQKVSIKRIEFVGPSVSNDLAQDGSIALIAALICILIYVSFRFEWRLAIGAVLALIHDVVITLGILSLLYIEIDLTILASLMSVIGYSLNDSIVVSDRVRENFRKISYGNAYDIFNISLTQTFSRTIITSATTLIVILILLFFGGAMLRGFSITLCIGIFIGTYSSIYIVSALALKLGIKREHLTYLEGIEKRY